MTQVEFTGNVLINKKSFKAGDTVNLEEVVFVKKGSKASEVAAELYKSLKDRQLIKTSNSETKNTEKTPQGSNQIDLKTKNTEETEDMFTDDETEADNNGGYFENLSSEELRELYFQKFNQAAPPNINKNTLIKKIKEE
jgi:ribosomal protein L21